MGRSYIGNVSFSNLQFRIVALGLTVASAAHKWLVKVTFNLCNSVPTGIFMSSNGGILCWGSKETKSLDGTSWVINFVPQDMRSACARLSVW